MANNNNGPDMGDLIYWIVTVIFLASFWPVGVIMLLRKLLGGGRSKTQQARHPYDIQKEKTAAPGTQGMSGSQARRQTPPAAERSRQGKSVDLDKGKGMTIGGAVMAGIFGIALVSGLPEEILTSGLMGMVEMSPVIGFFILGLALIWMGTQRTKKSRRFRKYLALIGKRESVSVATLAQAMPVSLHKACDDLQEMLDTGILKTGYLDMGSGRLILSEEGIQEEPAPEPEQKKAEREAPLDMNDDNAVLEEIRRVNDAIKDETMSRKIDRIGAITGKIFAYQKQNPGQAGQLRSFLSYYLPTTLKILKAYAQMEAQGVEGENISQTKARIEGMMDKVVEGFEKQLDKLFQDSAMDITTDVEVLEKMLEKDGLSGGQGMTLGG